MDDKRHLNVISASATEDTVPTWSAERWIVLGAILIVVVWLPLGMLSLWVSGWVRLGVERMTPWFTDWPTLVGLLQLLAAILPVVGSFALAAYLGGITAVRFGPLRRPYQPALAGALAGVLVVSLAAAGGALRPWLLGVAATATLISIGSGAAACGGRWGRRLPNAANLMPPGQLQNRPRPLG
jgi:hypothetical protein